MPPPAIGTTLLAGYDASTLGLANGANVSTWPDMSGNGFDMGLQGTNPAYQTPSALPTGLGAVYFGPTDRLRVTGITSHTNATYFIVSVNPSDGLGVVAYFNDQLTRRPFFAKWTQNGRFIWGTADSGGFFIEFTDLTLIDVACIWTGTIQATGAILRANGSQRVSGNLAGVAATTGLEIGNPGQGDWLVGEYLVYDGIVSGGDIDTVEAYLDEKWITGPADQQIDGDLFSADPDWPLGSVNHVVPPVPSDNRMGGTGAIRKPPR